jgi:hypothetical protein
MKRFLATLVLFTATGLGCTERCARAAPTMGSPMIETLRKICDFVTERPRTAMAVAQRFGMHLHDNGSWANITFTPRDRGFSEGSAGRKWESQQLNDVTLVVAPPAVLTFGELRAAFGKQLGNGDVGQHGDGISFTFDVDPHPQGPMECAINADVVGNVSLTNPGDDVRIRKLSIVPGTRLGTRKPKQ